MVSHRSGTAGCTGSRGAPTGCAKPGVKLQRSSSATRRGAPRPLAAMRAQREQQALAVGLAERHRLQRGDHLVLEPGPQVGRAAPRARRSPRRRPRRRTPRESEISPSAASRAARPSNRRARAAAAAANSPSAASRRAARPSRGSRGTRRSSAPTAAASPAIPGAHAGATTPALPAGHGEREHVADPSLGARGVAHDAGLDGGFQALRIAVRADRQRRARELQQAREGDGSRAGAHAASLRPRERAARSNSWICPPWPDSLSWLWCAP